MSSLLVGAATATLGALVSMVPDMLRLPRRARAVRRYYKQANYRANGLNGPRAMARRARQEKRIELRKKIAAHDLVLRNAHLLPEILPSMTLDDVVQQYTRLQAEFAALGPRVAA